MKEIENHIAYKQLNNEYERIALDYVIMSVDTEYEGIITHKNAVIKAFQILNTRYGDDYYDKRFLNNMAYSVPNPITYWFAFLEPPQGNQYRKKDFVAFNESLFPNKNSCKVYRWDDEFSNYFDEGKEWWGTGLWSIYDCVEETIVIIGASLTD